MAIDMSTVKAITHNNKDVVKIEDSLGNVLWQKQVSKAYRQLDYIIFNGAEYINSSLSPRYPMWLEMLADQTSYEQYCYFGCGQAYGTSGKQFACIQSPSSSTNKWGLHYGKTIKYDGPTGSQFGLNTKRKIEFYNVANGTGYMKVYNAETSAQIGSTSSASIGDGIPDSNVYAYIMAKNYKPSSGSNLIQNHAKAKLYSLIIRDTNSTGTILRNFVPCQQKSTNRCGLYDIENNVFYRMYGTSTTTSAAGPTVEENPSWSPNA